MMMSQQIVNRIVVSFSFAIFVAAFSPKVEYTLLIYFLTILYAGINRVIESLFPGTIILDGKPTPKFRLYVSIFHSGMVASSMLSTILFLHACGFGTDTTTWLQSGWIDWKDDDNNKSFFLAEALDVLTLCITIAFEIKDGLVDDFDFSMLRIGIYVHHLAAAAGCLYILNCSYGKGYMLFSGVQALVTSFFYCIWRLDQLSTPLYCVILTTSNVVSLWFTFKYYLLAQTKGDFTLLFPLIVGVLLLVRQYPVAQIIIKRLSNSKKNNSVVAGNQKIG